MQCDSCCATVINGVFCHEHGCPNANNVNECHNTRNCKACSKEFIPDSRGQFICNDCCARNSGSVPTKSKTSFVVVDHHVYEVPSVVAEELKRLRKCAKEFNN